MVNDDNQDVYSDALKRVKEWAMKEKDRHILENIQHIAENPTPEDLISRPQRAEFPDKKQKELNPKEWFGVFQKVRFLAELASVGQKEGKVILKPQYPDLPIAILLFCDSHIGSIRTDYELIEHDLEIVRQMPNFYMVTNGDEVDNFVVNKFPTGIFEDIVDPTLQALVFRKSVEDLDKAGKLVGMSFGNHNDWSYWAGVDWNNTWLRDFSAPVLSTGGKLTLKLGEQEYIMAITHRYWGYSRFNPTNACKRYLEHEYPDAEIIFLGHTHTAVKEEFQRPEGQDRVAVVGGTYKVFDEYARKAGIGGRGQRGGITILLYPDSHKIQAFYKIEDAVDILKMKIEHKNIQKALPGMENA